MAEYAAERRGQRHRGDHRRRPAEPPTCPAWSPRTRLLPVLGVPVQSECAPRPRFAALDRPDAAAACRGTLAIGKAGAANAALLAVSILATHAPSFATRCSAFRAEQERQVRQDSLS